MIKTYISPENKLKLEKKKQMKRILVANGYKELPGKFWVDPKGIDIYREFKYHFRQAIPKTPEDKYKYKMVSYLNRDYYLHRLVYKAHVGPIPEGLHIDHIDGDKYNNHFKNLKAITKSENSSKAMKQTHADGKMDDNKKPIVLIGPNLYFESTAELAKWIHEKEPHRSLKAIRVALAKDQSVGKYKARFIEDTNKITTK